MKNASTYLHMLTQFNLDDVPRKNLRAAQAIIDKMDLDTVIKNSKAAAGVADWVKKATGLDC